mgnify:CR=1 FL=1
MSNYVISAKDREILREVANKQHELSQAEKNLKRIEEWYAHNSLKGERPMIHLEMWTFAQEILPQRLRCDGEFAREVETNLYCNFLNQELFDDDRVTPHALCRRNQRAEHNHQNHGFNRNLRKILDDSQHVDGRVILAENHVVIEHHQGRARSTDQLYFHPLYDWIVL